jgi:hypothetical protein
LYFRAGTLDDVNVCVYDSNMVPFEYNNGVSMEDDPKNLYDNDYGTETSMSLSHDIGQVFYIKVTAYWSTDFGTYEIGFSPN